MTTPRFVHLRLHSEFSITDGIVRLDEAVGRAVADGMPALGLSDLANLFGMVKFYKACRGKGVKPVVGADVWVENPDDADAPFRLLLLARNRDGYLTLCQLLTDAYRTNQRHGRAEIKRDWLTPERCRTLLALSGAHMSDVGRALLDGQLPVAQAAARDWAARFGDGFYLEIQRYGAPHCDTLVERTLWLAGETGLPVVATHPVQFMHRDDHKAHEARVCIAKGEILGDRRRARLFTEEQYFKSTAEMAELFADLPEALANSVEIAKRCNVTIQLGKNYLPDFPTPDGMTLDDYLIHRANEGLVERMQALYPDPNQREAEMPRYRERLKFELDTIIQMGFPGYFLIVADFINWAKHNGCPVGPGRGSGAGSLVAYSIGITDIDPLAYALLFERFLNPERVSMPDFDIDFCQDNRWRVIEYVREKYGADAVSQIVTFGTMAAKAVVRDVGRVLDLPYMFCDGLSKLIPAAPGKQYSLDDAVEMEPILKDRLAQEEEVAELWELAKKLEGLTRNIGMHAGGVLIAPGKITDFCPMYQAGGEDASPVSQFDKDDVEQVGLVKFDFLGLRNLTIIDLAVRYIKQLQPDFSVDMNTMPFTDPAAYKVLQEANTTAVFQLESDGMKKLLEKLKPDRFEDIIAVLALYRPGPLGSGMVDDFILRKAGKQAVDYFHPDLTACLEPTYGVIVYQEQVMQISQIIGGYTLGGADMLRRAMGKKKPEEMAKHRSIIAEGAKTKGYDPALAEQLFDLMTKFAEYGFNKSHTAAYAVVSYQTAWLKAHYPSAFMAATMSSELDNTDQLRVFYDDSLKNKLKFLPPDINHSHYRFVPTDRQHIRYALGAIKGTGEAAVEHLIAEREAHGPFVDLFDFCRRTDKRIVNRRAIETMIRAGAFDGLDDNRAKLLANVELAMSLAEQAAANINQGGLFDDFDDSVAPPVEMKDVPAWSEAQRLAEEKLAIGFYLSGHPFSAHAATVRRFVKNTLASLSPKKEPQTLAGVVTLVRTKVGSRGKMAFVQLDDGTAKHDVSLFSEAYEANRHKLREDALLIVEGKVSYDDFSGGLRIVVDSVLELAEAQSRFAQGLALSLHAESDVGKLKHLLQPFAGSGPCPLRFRYAGSQARGELDAGEAWNVMLSDALLDSLRALLGEKSVEVLM
ncbi:DNA polymerase III subunit alpha [Rivihabitans pingtungensis]|uniref:DNA polymerase III subunit alpha n=1 Tax=Rivihabitans pingtungensis TaxID=1054498 RepID=UPI002353E39C|nr:DNA polymerase III subunit alpha [Rivihabitans pingtungensis]MCK6437115.1 DNA polymerase III subunit alpha [Rivihabitans pingtungensis]